MHTKQCVQCSKTFSIDERDALFYQRIIVPEPTHCPSCRYIRQMAWRNERNFYSRSCDLCHKAIISAYAPDSDKVVYCAHCWWSDAWEGQQFARDIDWSRPFFEQYADLLKTVPALALMNDNGSGSENCEYTYDFAFGKNAYMVICSWQVENAMYTYQTNHVKDVYDSLFLLDAELIYEGVVVEKSYNCQYLTLGKNCRDIIFGYDLQNCSDCILSAGLRNKQYCIWNKQYTQAEYTRRKQELGLDRWSNIKKHSEAFADFILKIPRRYANVVNCEEVTGDYLLNCSQTRDSYLLNNLVNCRYCIGGDRGKDCYDINNSGNPELCYESVTPDQSYYNLFTVFCWKSQFLTYSDNCHSSHDLFGCVGLRKAQYSILNKPYAQADYQALRTKLVAYMTETGEWGEFFPIRISPFCYNESVAQQITPLTQEQVLRNSYRWREAIPTTTGKETVQTLPDSIQDSVDQIIKEILACELCRKNYKILPAELQFYKTALIPLPRWCLECRYQKRRQRINPYALWHRQCMCTQTDHQHSGRCANEFETTYSPERLELVYCADCYKKEIY